MSKPCNTRFADDYTNIWHVGETNGLFAIYLISLDYSGIRMSKNYKRRGDATKSLARYAERHNLEEVKE